MPQAMYKREKNVHLTTSAVKIGYKHLWNSKFNFWMLKQPHLFLRLCALHSSAVSKNTEKILVIGFFGLFVIRAGVLYFARKLVFGTVWNQYAAYHHLN
jgi:hypothetical protein